MKHQLHYGGVPVPYTVSWSAEESFRVERCQFAGAMAICQDVSPGQGKPQFGKPHAQRQREAIAAGLCDLCGKPLKLRTKVSLSHAKPRGMGARGIAILQVEPLLHKECALASMKHCPSLKRDIAAGTLFVRQVTRSRVQMALMSPEYVQEVAGRAVKAVGHAKVELLNWIDRDAAWLEAA